MPVATMKIKHLAMGVSRTSSMWTTMMVLMLFILRRAATIGHLGQTRRGGNTASTPSGKVPG